MSPVAMDGDSPYPAWKQNPHATDSALCQPAAPETQDSSRLGRPGG